MGETSIIAGYKELKRQNKVGDPERHKLCMAANKILADSGLPEYLLSTLRAFGVLRSVVRRLAL